ncbi:MAG: anti-sigma factor [Acidimicrobiia bacterium]|nr:anti-sigma factor [Acidimicrobiia bacterium]
MSNDEASKPGRSKRLAAIVFGVGLVAAACGADGDTATSDGGSTTGPAVGDEAMEDEAMEAETDDEAMDDSGASEDEAMEDGRPILEVTFEGLEALGDDFDYEAWTIVDGTPVSGGTFDIAADGSLEIGTGEHLLGHEGASTVVITIEPAVGDDPAPADTHVLAGDVAVDGSFALTIDHPDALGTDFADVAGQFILGTPTNDPDGDELSGIWFLTVPGPEVSLELPTLPAGWSYEGWAVIDGNPVSTGRFLDGAMADDFDGFSGPNGGPNYPGEDFIVDAPDGLAFPTDLTGSTVVISVEPDADNSPDPFALEPLVAEVPDGIGDHQNIDLGLGSVAISGSGSIAG